MTRRFVRLAIAAACSLLASVAFASHGSQDPRQCTPSAPADHHAARPAPNSAPTPTMPGPTAAQVLSGPLMPLTPASTSPFSAAPWTFAPHYVPSPFHRSRGYGGSAFALGGYGPLEFAPGVGVMPGAQRAAPNATGTLLLDVEPGTARVYVDGVDVGVVSDFRRTGLTLLTGPHRIELTAPGYESLTIEVTIVAGWPTRYRGNLPAARAPAPEPAPRHDPDTFYVVPGCYAGNRTPSAQTLPPGCDVARLRTVPIR
ncbi:MAG: PEGA domain-containing protein [Acidobacteria bacterium]|nr:PEGA domain-containing protein [Acidobacteriota bacterium]